MTLRGVILAGGKGSRLGELTKVTNNHLLPVDPYPMVYHPLKKPVGAGVRHYLKQGRLLHHMLEGYWTDAGTLESLAHANQLVHAQPPSF
jgi:dTDP-glucose pyrophosphorylase